MSTILYIVQFFSTENEPAGQGSRHYKHAMALAKAGHKVTVVTGTGTTMCNPEKQKEHEESNGSIKTASPLPQNLEIIRLKANGIKKSSKLLRIVCLMLFFFKAIFEGVKASKMQNFNYDIVLGSSPPLTVAFIAYLLSLLNRADLFLEVRDLWSKTLAANGFIKSKAVIQLNQWAERILYKHSKKIIVLAPSFADDIDAMVPGAKEKVTALPNAADLEFFEYPKLWTGSFLREEASGLEKKFHVNFAGVFSNYTHLETLLEAAAIIQNQQPDIQFNLVGDGYRKPDLIKQAERLQLRNLTFWEPLAKNRISKFMMEGDLSIINYRALDIFSQVLPNKLFDYLAAGKPILAAVPNGEVSGILEDSGAGFSIAPEDVESLVSAVLWFYNNREQASNMGLEGSKYVAKHFNRKHLTEKFLTLFPLHPALPKIGAALPQAKFSDVPTNHATKNTVNKKSRSARS
ncbi:MAG: glycosyltransferase family 4 protein [Cyanobacteria bacterium P01_H01_bin.74]